MLERGLLGAIFLWWLIAAVLTQPYAYQLRQHQVQDGKLHGHLMVKGQTFHTYQGPILNRRFFFFCKLIVIKRRGHRFVSKLYRSALWPSCWCWPGCTWVDCIWVKVILSNVYVNSRITRGPLSICLVFTWSMGQTEATCVLLWMCALSLCPNLQPRGL